MSVIFSWHSNIMLFVKCFDTQGVVSIVVSNWVGSWVQLHIIIWITQQIFVGKGNQGMGIGNFSNFINLTNCHLWWSLIGREEGKGGGWVAWRKGMVVYSFLVAYVMYSMPPPQPLAGVASAMLVNTRQLLCLLVRFKGQGSRRQPYSIAPIGIVNNK